MTNMYTKEKVGRTTHAFYKPAFSFNRFSNPPPTAIKPFVKLHWTLINLDVLCSLAPRKSCPEDSIICRQDSVVKVLYSKVYYVSLSIHASLNNPSN